MENVEEHPDLLSQSNRSVILVLNTHDPITTATKTFKLAFRDVVVGLVANQLVMQLVTALLLHDKQLILGNGPASLLMKSITHSPICANGNTSGLVI
jgi:hypothetical protein